MEEMNGSLPQRLQITVLLFLRMTKTNMQVIFTGLAIIAATDVGVDILFFASSHLYPLPLLKMFHDK